MARDTHTHTHKRASNAVGNRFRKDKGTHAEWTESTGERHWRHKKNVKGTEAQVPWLIKKT